MASRVQELLVVEELHPVEAAVVELVLEEPHHELVARVGRVPAIERSHSARLPLGVPHSEAPAARHGVRHLLVVVERARLVVLRAGDGRRRDQATRARRGRGPTPRQGARPVPPRPRARPRPPGCFDDLTSGWMMGRRTSYLLLSEGTGCRGVTRPAGS